MIRRGLLLLLVPAVLVLAACGTGDGTSSPSPDSTVAAPVSSSPTPSETALAPVPVVPQQLNPADYVIDGNIGAAEDVWGAIVGFYTDASKAVMCDMHVSSETPGYATCEIVAGHESAATYAKPASYINSCPGGNDGYEVGVGIFQQTGVNVAFDGCQDIQSQLPAAVAATKVIPDGGSITINKYTCSSLAGVATCTLNAAGPHFVFGLSVATIVN